MAVLAWLSIVPQGKRRVGAGKRAALLQHEKANMTAELQALEEHQNAAWQEAETHQGDAE